jgi:CRP-like cAMP-binding protein
MLTPVERVLQMKGIDLLEGVGPRHLVVLARIAREVEISKNQTIYTEADPADALYVVVEGRVRVSTGDRVLSEVGPGEAFGTWALVDDSARGQRAICIEGGRALAIDRDEFYEVAAGDMAMLKQLFRVLARRLRNLVEQRPEEARIEAKASGEPAKETKADGSGASRPTASSGASLEAAVLDRPSPPPAVPEEKPPD